MGAWVIIGIFGVFCILRAHPYRVEDSSEDSSATDSPTSSEQYYDEQLVANTSKEKSKPFKPSKELYNIQELISEASDITRMYQVVPLDDHIPLESVPVHVVNPPYPSTEYQSSARPPYSNLILLPPQYVTYEPQKIEETNHSGSEEGSRSVEDHSAYGTAPVALPLKLQRPNDQKTSGTAFYNYQVEEFEPQTYSNPNTKKKEKEVHYHQHKHLHDHQHKQEHHHKHEQHHAHDHKHGHHEESEHEHKHQEVNEHHHKAEHYHGHKDDHHHDEKSQHWHDHKQDHKHAHYHDQKHDHKDDHKHEHQHNGEHDHKHHGNHKHQHQHGHNHKGNHWHQHRGKAKHVHGHKHKVVKTQKYRVKLRPLRVVIKKHYH